MTGCGVETIDRRADGLTETLLWFITLVGIRTFKDPPLELGALLGAKVSYNMIGSRVCIL